MSKPTRPFGWSTGSGPLEKLRQMAQADSLVSVINEHLSRADLLSLLASGEVLVSLHRAEAARALRVERDDPGLGLRLGRQAARDLRHRRLYGREGSLKTMLACLASPEVRAGHKARARWLLERRADGCLRALCASPCGFFRDLNARLQDRLSPGGPVLRSESSCTLSD